MELTLTSSAFEDGQEIPDRNTGEGIDISPDLNWSNVPQGTREFAVICEDADLLDSDGQPKVHWVVYNISPSVTFLPEGLPPLESIEAPVRADQGINSFEKIGYSGPTPTSGTQYHRYLFRIFALDTELSVPPACSRSTLMRAMEGHLLNEGLLIGVYRKRVEALPEDDTQSEAAA